MTKLDIAKSCKSIINNAVEKVIEILNENNLRLNEDAYAKNMYGRVWTDANGHIIDNTFYTFLNMANEINTWNLTVEELAAHFTSIDEIKAEIQKRKYYDSPKNWR